MFNLRYRIALAFAGALLFASCEHADPLEEGGLEPTLASIQTNIFDTNCALSGCHIGGSPNLPGSMDLRSGAAYSNLVGVASQQRPTLSRVEPNDPDASYLVRKIEGGPDISGGRMPFGRPALTQEQIDAIREWIGDGALDKSESRKQKSELNQN